MATLLQRENNAVTVILYFYRLANSSGGAERSLISLANKLSAQNYKIHIVTWDNPGSKSFYKISRKVKWHQLRFDIGLFGKIKRALNLYFLIRRIDPEVLVGFVMGADKIVYLASILTGVPIIAAERNSPEMYLIKLNKLQHFFYMKLFLLTKYIVVQIDSYRFKYPKFLWSRIISIPNFIHFDPAKFSHIQHNAKNANYILCVSRLDPQKNLITLVNAFASLADTFPSWNLLIVGSGSMESQIKKVIRSSKLNERVLLKSSTKNIEKYYAMSDIFCLPSIWEGFPNALAEALAHGLPSVGFSECDGVNYLINHKKNGLLAKDINSSIDLSSKLGILMSDPILRSNMSSRATKILNKYNHEKIVNLWSSAIQSTKNV
jgi:glycosyltransferase involved in cell wall biosynthesis